MKSICRKSKMVDFKTSDGKLIVHSCTVDSELVNTVRLGNVIVS